MVNGEERVVFLFDTHVPYNVPLDPVFEFIEDFKPHRIILGGDLHDFESVCHWIADQSRNLDGGTVKQNFEELSEVVFEPLQKAIPKSCKVIYLEGNHEDWLNQAAAINPNGRGFWELRKNVPKEIEIIPINVPYRVSQYLYTIHGTYTNEFNAKKTAQSYHKTVFYGHTHSVQSHTLVSPIDSEVVFKGQSCGSLCKRNPNYLRNRPNAWVLGFNFTYIEKSTGYFWDTQVHIIDGKFYANGRRYK